jgi:hypothetical protein
MDSYLSLARANQKNKNLLEKIQLIQLSYKKLLEYNAELENRFSQILQKTNSETDLQRAQLISSYENQISILVQNYDEKLRLKDEEIVDKVSNEEIEQKNMEIERLNNTILKFEKDTEYEYE